MLKSTAKAGSRKRRVLLVDDHPILRESFGELINLEGDLEVCGQAAEANGALAEVRRTGPDLVVVDIELKGSNGLELIKRLKALFPDLPVLALSVHDEVLYAERALRAGARGYVMKQAALEEVMGAMRHVLQGKRYLSAKMQERMFDMFSSGGSPSRGSELERLSDRELEVLQLIGNGVRTREIAEQLSISVKTVESYRAHIMEKLNLQDAMELVRYAVEAVASRSARV